VKTDSSTKTQNGRRKCRLGKQTDAEKDNSKGNQPGRAKRNINSNQREKTSPKRSEQTAQQEKGNISRSEQKDGNNREYTLGVRTWPE
jgi:hypothetical protein